MKNGPIATRLDERLRAIPDALDKSDPDAAVEVLADWIRALPSSDRDSLVLELIRWVRAEASDEWKSRAALRLGLMFGEESVLRAAIDRASTQDGSDTYNLQLDIIDAVSRWPTDLGIAYLRKMSSGVDPNEEFEWQRSSIRAAIALCFLTADAPDRCLREVLDRLRSISDTRLTRSALALMHALFVVRRNERAVLESVLDPSELTQLGA